MDRINRRVEMHRNSTNRTMLNMLKVYIPEEYHSDQKALRAINTFGIDAKGAIPADAKKVVWAVADRTAEETNPVDYREYDYSQADIICFGGDDQILIDTGLIKPEHDTITIPDLAWSLYMHQAIAVILSHYITHYECEERKQKIKAAREKVAWRKRLKEQRGDK